MQILRTTVAAIAVLSSVFTLVGCGPSQEEMMMKAARRPRVDSEANRGDANANPSADSSKTAPPTQSNPQPESRLAASEPSAMANAGAGSPQTPPPVPPTTGGGTGSSAANAASASGPSDASSGGGAGAQGATIASTGDGGLGVPVSNRKPSEALDETARAARAAENMKKIGEALILYTKEKNRFPLPAMKSNGGLPTLSWRVELLPWLGYEELYKQFDPNQPWDSPANMRLLELIPDCYVSPERFDTNTNYLGISGRNYLFNGEPVVLRKIEDGLDNTLAVVEVNDSASVPWTCPEDFVYEQGALAERLGGLRPGGSYALWANGWLTLLREGISEELVQKAFTYESGDGIVAPDIHQPVRFSKVAASQPSGVGGAGDAPPPTGQAPIASTNETSSDSTRSETRPRSPSPVPTQPAVREPIPPLSQLTAARDRLEPIFAPKFREAKDQSQRIQIAKEMLDAAQTMTADPAGAFALQTAAMEAYAAMGQFEEMMKAVDAQVVRFEVDAVKTNADALVLFSQKNNSALAAQVDNREFLRRFVPLAMLALRDDLYDPLLEIIPAAIAVENQQRQRIWIADLNRLKQQLVSARNQFRQLGDAMDQLRREPNDPEANQLVGRYVAFIRGDWQIGLPLLSLGNNERLAAIANLDLATPATNPSAMVKTADQWWELGESTSNDLFKGSCHQRAAHWYRSAYEQLPDSLERLHAKAKLEDCGETNGGSPKSTLESMSERLGIQLETAIAQLLNPAEQRLTQADIDP